MKRSTTGKQIQTIAYLLCGLGCFASIVGGLVYYISYNIIVGLLVAGIGCYISWACTRCLKGFGELVENAEATRETNDRILDVLESMYTRELEAEAAANCTTPPSSDSVIVKTAASNSAKIKQEYRPSIMNYLIVPLLILIAFVIIGVANSSTTTPSATATPTKKVVITAAPTKTPYVSTTPYHKKRVTAKPTAAATVTPTAAPTSTPAPTPEETTFTVEHDEEYHTTQEYIYQFLTKKGYEVQTIIGVPNIGRYEDTVPTDAYVNWYAYIKSNGKWQEYVVVLFNGEVSAIRPIK